MDKRRPTEYDHQRAVFGWAEIISRRHPDFEMIVGSLNGIWIQGKNKWQIIKTLQAAGCFPVGYPDVFWPLYRKPYSGLYIELKRDRKSKVNPDQVKWQNWLTIQRFFATISWSENDTKDILMRYCNGGMTVKVPNN